MLHDSSSGLFNAPHTNHATPQAQTAQHHPPQSPIQDPHGVSTAPTPIHSLSHHDPRNDP